MHQDRQALVLRIVVEKYIRTHEPVASGSVVKEFPVPISSATIRNDMPRSSGKATSSSPTPPPEGCPPTKPTGALWTPSAPPRLPPPRAAP